MLGSLWRKQKKKFIVTKRSEHDGLRRKIDDFLFALRELRALFSAIPGSVLQLGKVIS